MKPTLKQLIYPMCRNLIYQTLVFLITIILSALILTSLIVIITVFLNINVDNKAYMTTFLIISLVYLVVIIMFSLKYSFKQVFFKPYKRIVITPKFEVKLEKEKYKNYEIKTASKYHLPSKIVYEYICLTILSEIVYWCIVLAIFYVFNGNLLDTTESIYSTKNIVLNLICMIISYIIQYFVLKHIICKYTDVKAKAINNN